MEQSDPKGAQSAGRMEIKRVWWDDDLCSASVLEYSGTIGHILARFVIKCISIELNLQHYFRFFTLNREKERYVQERGQNPAEPTSYQRRPKQPPGPFAAYADGHKGPNLFCC